MKYALISSAAAVALSFPLILNSQSAPLYIIFTLLIIILLQALPLKSVSIFLKFFIGLFVLGNWLKVTLRGVFNHPYVEATGQFAGTAEQWDSFFTFSIVISISLLAAVALNMAAPRKTGSVAIESLGRERAKTFTRLSIVIILVTYALNWQFGFFRIGVKPDVHLPFGLGAPASFLVFLGAPMLIAIIASDSVAQKGRVTVKALIGVAAISLISSIVTYSRASIAILMLPIVLGMYAKSCKINGYSQSISAIFIVMSAATAAILASVSVARILVYGVAETITREALSAYLYESLGLFLDRWIGAEGLMVAVSSSQSVGLFVDMLRESPELGVRSIYQHLSASQYLSLKANNMTFLTLPGFFALLAFSGSHVLVFFGVLGASLFGVLVSHAVIKLFPGHYALQYLISGNIAYQFSQMIFPVLFLPYVLQLAFFLIILKLYYSGSVRNR